MFTERFYEVIGTDGIAAIGSCAGGAVHLVNTWNKYLQVVDGAFADRSRLILPVRPRD